MLVGTDWRIEAISANAAMLGDLKPASLIGQPLSDLIGGQSVHALRNRMSWLTTGESDVHDFGVQWGDVLLDVRAIRAANRYLIEAELAVEPRLADAIGMVRSMSDRLDGDDPLALARQAMRQLCTLTGFDRLTLCDRRGEILAGGERGKLQMVMAEHLNNATEVALIADRDAEPVPVLGDTDSGDLARASYLAPAANESEQLAKLGVAATMALPLRIDGELVGAVHAHHGAPRRCGAERRGVAHLFAERLVARMARHGWQP